jgi:multidrug efflux pump subunit AcrA (membrane-fusion protein)
LQYGDTNLQNELKSYFAEANDKNRSQEKIKKYQEYESKYQKEHKIWEDQVAAIKRECEKKANDKVSAEKEVLLADIESKYSNARDQLSAQLQSLKEEKATAESSLNALGLFAFSEKKNAKARIAELAAQIEKAEQQLKAANQELDSEKEKLARWEAEKREQLLSVMKDENPLPPEPVRAPIVLDDGTTMTAAQFENQCMMDLILEGMRPGIFYERTDLLEIVSSFKKVSIQRIAAISNSMVERGYLQRVTEGGVVYFGLR